MVPDLSYGSHFFQDLVETGIAFAALFPEADQCRYSPDILGESPEIGTRSTAPAAAVRVYDVGNRPLQLRGDVVRQQLACFFAD